MVKKLLVLVACFIAMGFNVMAQNVSGKVTDAGGVGVPGVTVAVKGSSTATMTDAEGSYRIAAGGNATLVFTAVGYTSQEIAVSGRSVVNVELAEDNTVLQEVVVTAMGIQREKKSLGYAVQELKGDAMVEARETNLANAFSGKVAGLQVMRGSTGAGSSSKIVLRGYTSLTGDNQPLIVVDGIPMDNTAGTQANDFFNQGTDYGNGLGDINPDDIQSISVLKGPSAAALYGSRAGNGVIMVTTKSGRKQPGLGITFSTSLGTETIFMRPETQNTYGQGDEGVFDPTKNISWGPRISGQSVTKWDGSTVPLQAYDNVNTFLQNGTTQNYSLGLQQQFGTTGVYTSVSFTDDRGIIPGNKLNRVNFSTRATSSFGRDNRWTSDVKIAYNNTAGFNRPITGKDRSSIYSLMNLPVSMDIADFSAAKNDMGKMLWYPGALAWTPNPYWASLYDLNEDSRNRFLMNGSLKYAFTDWLDAELKVGGDLYSNNREKKTYAGSPRDNYYELYKGNFSEMNYSALVKGTKDNVIGKLGGSFTLGGNLMDRKFTSLSGSASLLVPDFFVLGNIENPRAPSHEISRKKINSVFGSVGVNYGGYLFLDMTARNDWSSAMIKENMSYFYPSYSLSYVLSDHMGATSASLPSWISYTKLRASYATVGNDLTPYNLYNVYNLGTGPGGEMMASRESVLKDPNVRSELIKNLEFGAEMRFMNNRFGLDFTWYKSNSTRQLLAIPMDPLSGFSSRMLNAGNIQNKGWELMATANILTNPNGLGWSIVANASRNENKIIDILSEEGVDSYGLLQASDDFRIMATSGKLFGEIYGTKFLRVKDEKSPYYNQLILTSQGLPQADTERTYLGNQQAKALLGITNSFTYKNFGLSFLVDGRFGGKIFSATQAALQANGVAAATAPGGSREDFVLEGVVGTDGDYTKNTTSISQQDYWRIVGTTGNLGIIEANLYDATNIRLRNITLNYALPKKMLGNVFQSARASFGINNVWMIKSHMNGIDPESVFATGTNAVGLESGGVPTMRAYRLSLSFGF